MKRGYIERGWAPGRGLGHVLSQAWRLPNAMANPKKLGVCFHPFVDLQLTLNVCQYFTPISESSYSQRL